MDYKPTLRLPKTDFPMKADLPNREPAIAARWDSLGVYARLRAERKGSPSFVFHDGPPYANGNLHIGHVLNKSLKDFVVRHRTMLGMDAPMVPGWDCHGLPIEHRVMKEAGNEARNLSPTEIRDRCRTYASHFLDLHRAQLKRLGCAGDYENRYATMDPAYEDGVLSVFQSLVEKGYVTRDKRSTAWCPNCATALAEAELEYRDRESPSVYVRMRVGDPAVADRFRRGRDKDIAFLIWTTTPWTLPANMAIAVHPDLEYTAARCRDGDGRETFNIVAVRRLEAVARACGFVDCSPSLAVRGSDLVGTTYRHPLAGTADPPVTGGAPLDAQPVVAADYVSAEDGTGCVHTAPGHGADDFRTGKAHGLPPFSPLDDHGRYTDEAGPALKGKKANGDANEAVLALLGSSLLSRGTIRHSYAHCWRCKGPILFRATDQWFIKVDHEGLRARALAEVAKTRWVPGWGQRRIEGMVSSRPDWCISRQRHWGIPIPAVACGCGVSWTSPGLVRNTRAVVAKEGANAWFDGRPAAAFLGSEKCPSCGKSGGTLARDIFDVWFESGSSWRSVVQARPGHRFPSDAVLEGTDQHRGWFQSSLLTAVAAEGRAPWAAVVTHGFITDPAGEKVSKSKGGLLDVDEVAKEFGADVGRLWVATTDYHEDVAVSRDLLKKIGESYRRIRNTFRWILGNLDGFDPAAHAVADGDLLEADRWVLARLDGVVAEATAAFESYEFSRGVRAVHDFCDRDLSAFWFDCNKDRFYCAAAGGRDRLSGQTAAFRVADALCRLLAPVLVHTMDEVWQALPGKREESVHLARWPEARAGRDEGDLLRRWEVLRAVRADAAVACEALRAAKTIGGNPEARVRVRPADGEAEGVLRGFGEAALAELLMVSEAEILPAGGGKAGVEAEPSPHGKCARCWNLRPTVGKDARFADLCARCAGVVGAA